MKLRDVQTGQTYTCKVSGRIVPVRVDGIQEYYDYKDRLKRRIVCRTLKTGRVIVCRSATRLRVRLPDVPILSALTDSGQTLTEE